MESFRLKNIIILILALMNLCLLGLLGVRLTTGYSAQAEARQQMVQLFAAEGVSLDDGIIPGATPPAGLTLSRDPDEDEKLAGFLLGDELVTKEAINEAMKAAQTESFGYNEDEIVSSDIVGIRYGSLFDSTQTMVSPIGDDLYQVQVVSWYDNENSYTSQMVRTIKYFAELA